MFHIKNFFFHFYFIYSYYNIKIFTKNFFNYLRSYFRKLNSSWISLINHNNKIYFKSHNIISDQIILCDVFLVKDWLFVNQIGLNFFSKKWNVKIVSYGYSNRTFEEDAVYKSFGCENHHKILTTRKSLKQKLKKFYFEARLAIKTKEDLLNYKLGNVHLGRDIYESIIRTGLPTIKIADFITWEHIYKGILFYVFFDDYFKKNKVKGLFLSHDMYIHMGIVSKTGFQHDIPTYLLSDHCFSKLTYPYELHDRFKMYPKIFNDKVPKSKKKDALNWSRKTLNRRLNGEVGVEMFYQKESAFTNDSVTSQINGDSLNVVIATHEFYDNPYAFGDLLFNDFYDWLEYIGNISKKLDYKFYLKAHRDVNENEINHLKFFEKKYS